MGLKVIKCEVNDRAGQVIVEAPTIEEATSGAARQLAITKAAAAGLPRPGVSGNINTYPVDAEGNTSDDVVYGRIPAAAFRSDIPVTGGL